MNIDGTFAMLFCVCGVGGGIMKSAIIRMTENMRQYFHTVCISTHASLNKMQMNILERETMALQIWSYMY